MPKINEQDINYDKNSLYFGYSARVSILIVLFTILAIICGLLGYKLINYQEENNVKLIERGKIDYQVVLKENNIYDKNVIEKKENLTFLAPLVESINMDLYYKTNFDKDVEGFYNARATGELVIYNPKTKANYFIKKYELDSDDNILLNSKKSDYKTSLLIDYNQYNEIAKEFKKNYSKDAEAKFNVYLDITTKLSPLDYKTFKTVYSKLEASISLGKEEVEIIDTSIDNTKNIPFKQQKTTIYSIVLEGLLVLFVTFLIIVFIKLNKLLSRIDPKLTEYDRELKRILKEYDDIIVNVSILPPDGEYKKVVINDFEELLDLKEQLKEPIRFIEIAPKNKSYFFIKHDDEVFVYTLKNISRER